MASRENCRFVVDDETIFAGKTSTEIDLIDRLIRKTWKLMRSAYTKTYELDSHVTVHIEDKSTILEGYNITAFWVYLINGGRRIRISSTADLHEAFLIERRITEFLKESAVKCANNMNTAAPGA